MEEEGQWEEIHTHEKEGWGDWWSVPPGIPSLSSGEGGEFLLHCLPEEPYQPSKARLLLQTHSPLLRHLLLLLLLLFELLLLFPGLLPLQRALPQ